MSITNKVSWILIYDNVDKEYQSQLPLDAYDVRSYFPQADHGSILITTRLLNLGQLGTQLIVGRLDEQQAAAILMSDDGKGFEGRLSLFCFKGSYRKGDRSYINIDSGERKNLLKILDGLPLALIQARTFIRQSAISISEYLKLYEEQWLELMESSQMIPQDYQNTSLLTTWTLSYDAIVRKDRCAAKLLQLWACLHNEELWFELLQPASVKLASAAVDAPAWFHMVAGNKFAFSTSIMLLLDYSIINLNEDASGYSMHPVVQQWAWQMQEASSRAELAALATLVVGSAVPHHSQKDFWVMQRRLLPHADRCARMMSECATKGYALRSDFDANKNTESWSTLTSEAFNNLGNLYLDQRKFGQAEDMYVRALAGNEKTLGLDHPSTLQLLNDLGQIYMVQGKYGKAEDMYVRALAGNEKTLGRNHPSTLKTVNDLGHLYMNQGKYDQAEYMYARALVGNEETLGPDDLSTLKIVTDMGTLLKDQGRLEEAKSMYERALRGFEMTLGKEHPSTLKTVNSLENLHNAKET